MRRALLLGLALLAPALGARAQSITFTPDAVVGVSACGPSSTESITLTATPTGANNATVSLTGGFYRLFASKSPTTTSNGLTVCASDAGRILANDVPSRGNATQAFTVDTNDVLSAAAFTCTETSNTSVYVCALYFPEGASTATASATGTMTFSVEKPNAPQISLVEPAESALVVTWGEVSDASYYIIRADAVDASADPVRHVTDQVTNTSHQAITGLKNDVAYNVTVVAYSAADNPSDPSAPYLQTPRLVDDFWERYQNAGGQEQGGCSSGPADLLGMLLAAAGLARLRRRS